MTCSFAPSVASGAPGMARIVPRPLRRSAERAGDRLLDPRTLRSDRAWARRPRYRRGVRLGDVIAGRYEIVQRAGEGGMGAIYRALDHARGGQVAIKVLRRAEEIDVARFQREARLLAQISHPAIVTFVDHGFDEDRDPYLVMEWLAGETLADRLAGDGVSAQEAVALMRRIAEALGELHR